MNHPAPVGHAPGHAFLDHIDPEGGEGTQQGQDQRRPFHPGRNAVAVVQDVVGRAVEDRAVPELGLVVTDEIGGEDEARGNRPDRQQQQRQQHDQRAFVRLQRAVVGVIVMGVIVVQRLGPGFQLGVRRVIVVRVISMGLVLPDRLVVEGHEHQTP